MSIKMHVGSKHPTVKLVSPECMDTGVSLDDDYSHLRQVKLQNTISILLASSEK
jgi:hypothetical protein